MTTTQVIIPPLDSGETERASEFLALANDIVVDSDDTRKFADDELASIKRQRSAYEAKRKELKAPILEAGRLIDDMFKGVIEYADRSAHILSQKILSYDREVTAARAREQQEAERVAREQREKLEAEAKQLAAAGAPEAAEAVAHAAALVSAPVIPLSIPTSERSTAKRTTWSAEITDLMTLVKAVAAGQVPLEAIEPNMGYLNGRARLEKEKLVIAGVKAVGTESLASKRGVA